jgi:hypothetical protein
MHARLAAVPLLLALCAPGVAAREFVAQEADFQCLRAWLKVHNLRIFNARKRLLRKAMRIVERGRPGRRYPVGTIVQLIPFEAMVKRGGHFNPEGNDWEFFVLGSNPDGSAKILKRGKAEVVNVAVPCQQCHGAARRFDFVCEEDHGCIPLALDPPTIDFIQTHDPHCPAQP